MLPLTLRELAKACGVSVSHLARIESGGRFPSARVLRQIAKPLGFTEQELLVLAGYISPNPSMLQEEHEEYAVGRLDMRVAKVLAQEPPEVQRAVIKMLPVLRSIAKDIAQSDVGERQFSPDELEQFNGKDNPSRYVACCGKVYDVSKSSLWDNGDHQYLHVAGRDLTQDMEASPHGCEVLDKFPVVGELRQS